MSLKLEGTGVIYVVSAVMNNQMMWNIDNCYEFVLATVGNDGNIQLRPRCSSSYLMNLVQSGTQIQNMTIKDGKIALKGDREFSTLSSYNAARRICMAEVSKDGTDKMSYLVVDRYGQSSVVSRDEMMKMAKYKLVDNYYITEDNQLRRYPGQEVSRVKALKSLVVDTYSGMSNEELCELLSNNGFKLGYKSEKYSTKGHWGEPDEWVSYAWYDKNGAVIWYNCRVNEGKEDPFYAGAELYIDADVQLDAAEQVRLGVNLGQFYSNAKGHQRLYIDARNGLMAKYRSMLKGVKGINPWDFSEDARGLLTNTFSRRDYLEKLKSIAYGMHGAPSSDSDDMFLYSIYSDAAMYYTVQKFKGPLRDIFSSYESTFKQRLGESIARDIVGGILIDSNNARLVEKYLKAIRIELPYPLKQFIEDEKSHQKAQKEAREKQRKQTKNPKAGILSDIFRW